MSLSKLLKVSFCNQCFLHNRKNLKHLSEWLHAIQAFFNPFSAMKVKGKFLLEGKINFPKITQVSERKLFETWQHFIITNSLVSWSSQKCNIIIRDSWLHSNIRCNGAWFPGWLTVVTKLAELMSAIGCFFGHWHNYDKKSTDIILA